MSAIVSSADLFDFDEYNRQLAQASQNAAAFATASEASVNRIHAAYAGVLTQITQLQSQISNVNLGGSGSSGQLASLGNQVSGLTQRAAEYQAALARLNAAQSANDLSISDLKKLLAGLQQEYRQLIPTQADYAQRQAAIAAQVRAVSAALAAQNTVMHNATATVTAANGSYQHLSQQTADLRNQLRNMPGAFDLTTGAINRNNAAAVALQSQINQNSQALLRADQLMGQHQRNVGNYGSALRGMAGSALMAAGGIIGISSAFDAIKMGVGIINDMERLDAGLKAVSRDSDDFRHSQEFLIATADELGLEYTSLVKSYKLLKAATKDTVLEGKETENIFHAITEAGARLQLSNEDVEGTLLALTQMISKGHIQAEELRGQLGERLPAALSIMAAATGVSTEELDKMMKNGQLLAADVLPKFAVQLDKVYGGEAQGKIETMTAGWNRMTNEAKLFIGSLNENKGVTSFFNAISNGVASALHSIRLMVKDDAWGELLATMTGVGAFATAGSRKARAQKYDEQASFKTMSRGDRQVRLSMYDDVASGRTNDPNMSAAEAAKRATELRRIAFEADRQLAKQQARQTLNEDKKADDDALKAKLDRMKASTLKVRNAEIAQIEMVIADRKKRNEQDAKSGGDQGMVAARNALTAADQKYLTGLKALNVELAKKDKAQGKKDTNKAESDARKAESEADKKLRDSLSKSEATAQKELAILTEQHQDGLTSEQDYIEKRLSVTLAGLNDRQQLLKKAGKTETDDYQKVLEGKVKAESDYKRAQLQSDLKTNKGQTTEKLATLDSSHNSGEVTDLEYIEKRHTIIKQGIAQDQAILREAGQQETELYRATNAANEKEDADYYNRKIKAEEKAWKTQLTETKTALGDISRAAGESLDEQLNDLDRNYIRQEGQIKLAMARRTITTGDGEQRLKLLKMQYLRDAMQAVDSAFKAEEELSKETVNQKIEDLEKWKKDAIRTPAEILAAELAIADLRKALENGTYADRKRAIKSLAEYREKIDQQTNANEEAAAEKLQKKKQTLLQQSFQLASTLGTAIGDIAQNNAQHDLDVLSKQKDNELLLAGDNADAKAKIEADYNKKEAEIRRKQAIAQREAALFQIAISTAQGVASVLSTGGGTAYADFGISAGILTAFVLAAGAAQAIAVLAQPLPAYKTGKSASDPYAGPALAGEAGTELFVDREGASRLLTQPTLINTRPGDTIFTASETARLAAQWHGQQAGRQAIGDAGLMNAATTRLQTGRRDEMRFIMQGASGPTLTKKDMHDAFAQALDARPEHITQWDEDGMHTLIRKGHSRTEYLNRRFRQR